jgi:SAM-dependent methyltransferase
VDQQRSRPPARRAAAKPYDRAYFDRWYRRHGIGTAAEVGRAARYVLAATEHLLMRPVRRVLDIGCGEGAWRAPLVAARPGLRYSGIDPSEYAVRRYGRTRGITLGGIGDLADLADLAVRGRFDLVICSDVLAYVDDDDIDRGLAWIGDHLDGLAFLHAMTATDEFFGDRRGFHARAAADYLERFARHGLARVGPHLYAGARILPTLTALEGPLPPAVLQ